ncbi:MAG: histidinol-phosphate transaminase [Caulobacteraceae bacterium]
MIDKMISKKAMKLEAYKVEEKVRGILLDKNEAPWNVDDVIRKGIAEKLLSMEFNRYPDNACTELKNELSWYTGAGVDSICIGNGSDELIQITLQTFIDPGDKIVIQSPTFSMYKIYASMCGAEVKEYILNDSFEFDLDAYIEFILKENPKLIIICNPNNPTGGRLEIAELEKILKNYSGIVLVDEAYFEFSGLTAAGLVTMYDNLVVLRTFSKALGIAGLRVGYLLAGSPLVKYFERVRPPYNINAFSQAAAVEVLRNISLVKEKIDEIQAGRDRLTERLMELDGLECFKSWGNFILIRSPRGLEIYKRLKESGVHIKRFGDVLLRNCLRITIGSDAENARLCEIVKEVLYDKAG